MNAVNNVRDQNIVNRLSPMQSDILDYLRSTSAFGPLGDRIGHLPRTGEIVVGIGRDRDAVAYAAVSRSLKRLCQLGLVEAYSPGLCTPGKGRHYSLAAITVPAREARDQ